MRTLSAALLVTAAALSAQAPPEPPPAAFFQGRRAALMDAVRSRAQPDETHWILLRGAGGAPDMAQFYQDHDFYYLSGIVEPGLAMILDPATGRDELLAPPFNRFTAQWEGKRLAPGEDSAQATGFAAVGNARSLPRRLRQLLAPEDGATTSGEVVVWTFLTPQPNRTSTPSSAQGAARRQQTDPFDGRVSREEAFGEALRREFPAVRVEDVTPLVGALRAVKQPDEIAQIRAASEIAAAGIAEAMRSTEPGIYEFQIAAAARYTFSRLGAGPDAYAAIVGAGKNGCVLHYSALTKRCEPDDLIVMDYGPTVHGYCTDVTRTFPTDGTFSDEQRKLVEDVHAVQQAIFAECRPGARLSQLAALCRKLLRERGYRSLHGPCHHVGLAVHDKQGDELQPGMVITVEPGAYLIDEGMGCRIEDTILITEDGYENLSAGVPSTPDAIEALMRGEGLHQQAAARSLQQAR